MNFPHASQDSGNLPTKKGIPNHYSEKDFTTAVFAVFSLLIYYILQHLNRMSLPLSELLWNSVVWITPSRIVSRLDSSFEPNLAKDPEHSETGSDSKGHAAKSNAMRRILGLDGPGILTAVQRTRTLSNLGSVFVAKPNNSLPGLGNWDNSCYQNSILQALAALESLPAFLDQAARSDALQPTKTALREVVKKLNDPANVGKTVWTPAELKSMSSWQQQDAQEYFSKISDQLEKDTVKGMGRGGLERLLWSSLDATSTADSDGGQCLAPSRRTSEEESKIRRLPEELQSLIVRNPLEGLLAQRVGCRKCGYVEGLSFVPFNCLTVPLGKQWMYDIRTCLDDYTALEPIPGVECAKCTLLHAKRSLKKVLDSISPRNKEDNGPLIPESQTIQQQSLHERLRSVEEALENEEFSDHALKRCQILARNRVSTIKTRQAVIARAPKSLVVHINRSNFDELTGLQSKNLANVRYPQQLDLAPWCLGHSMESKNDREAPERWSVDPSKSMLSDGNPEDLVLGKPYVLRAVVTHYGRHENGHYICYRKSPYSSKNDGNGTESWWRLSDEEVTEVDEDIVLSQGGVFMLFYEQSASVLSPVSHQAAELQEHSKNAVEVPSTTSQDYETAFPEPDRAATEEEPPIVAESVSLTPPSSPGEIEPDAERPHPDENLLTMPSSEVIENTRTQSLPQLSAPGTSPSTLNPIHPSDVAQPATIPKAATVTESAEETHVTGTPKENRPIGPVPMRTAGPRNGRGSVGRAGKAMGSVAGFVQAN